jgi:Ca2+-binding EF-hand superfamily protein
MKNQVEPNMKVQKDIRGFLTGNSSNIKKEFLNRIIFQFKTIKKTFTELDRYKQGYISFDVLKEILESWGYECKE